ncbi:M16 family metallopeptidase [Limobrevibacterium gyesilva]|uniref:Insulinase family protein n=1 Tax=Limobrevibacterium gyesilva TaxID=2991712 RepID=A0AA42CFB7_9PROT|nr:pitrilysin family protein [Limobrevibacterium gyesilva]MCW3477018.1 insulinase family protein [Limobrevibacterium gyesilva]
MQIDQTTLPGGLTVVTARLPAFETVAVMVVVRAGSRDEHAGNSGVAHFLEHMAFKGTATRSAFDIAIDIECMGASINAFTSQEITAYHIVGLKDAVAEAVAILGDVLTQSRYAAEDVDLERGVIAQEIARNGDDPNALCIKGFVATAYPDQPLGRPVLGDPAFVAGATRDDLLAFIGRNYVTGNMVVTATGDVDHAWLLDLVGRHFAAIPAGPAPDGRAAPRYAGGFHRDQRSDFKQVNLVLGFPSVPVDAPGFFAHKMLSAALGGGMSSPLFQEVRQKRGLVYGVGAGSNHGSDFGLVLIQAGTTPDKLATCLEVACTEALRVSDAVQERDFMRARNHLLAELATVKERPFQLAIYLAGQFFRHGRATGPEVDLAAVRAVPVEDLKRAAETLFACAPTLSMVGPVGEADYFGIVTGVLGGE